MRHSPKCSRCALSYNRQELPDLSAGTQPAFIRSSVAINRLGVRGAVFGSRARPRPLHNRTSTPGLVAIDATRTQPGASHPPSTRKHQPQGPPHHPHHERFPSPLTYSSPPATSSDTEVRSGDIKDINPNANEVTSNNDKASATDIISGTLSQYIHLKMDKMDTLHTEPGEPDVLLHDKETDIEPALRNLVGKKLSDSETTDTVRLPLFHKRERGDECANAGRHSRGRTSRRGRGSSRRRASGRRRSTRRAG